MLFPVAAEGLTATSQRVGQDRIKEQLWTEEALVVF